MKTNLSDGEAAIRNVEFECKLNWLERLRLLFGRPLRVRQDFVFRGVIREHRFDNLRLDVAPIGGRLPE